MNAPVELVRQHLIDPEICIRCNTCEEMCPIDAVTHDARNYVVRFDVCDGCNDCIPPCPTGAIDNWRQVPGDAACSLEAQLSLGRAAGAGRRLGRRRRSRCPRTSSRSSQQATAGQGGSGGPPWSAAHPYVNLHMPARPAIATVAGNFRLTDQEACSDIRHIVLDFGQTAFPVLEGQSIGMLPPGLDAHGKPHHMRLYSVASPRNGERPGYNNLSLTVKRVVTGSRRSCRCAACARTTCAT